MIRPFSFSGTANARLATAGYSPRHCEPTGRANACPMTGSAKQSRGQKGSPYCFVARSEQFAHLSLRHAFGDDGVDEGGIRRFICVKADSGVEFGAGLHLIDYLV